VKQIDAIRTKRLERLFDAAAHRGSAANLPKAPGCPGRSLIGQQHIGEWSRIGAKMDLRRQENRVPSVAQTFGQELVDAARDAGSVKKGNAEIEGMPDQADRIRFRAALGQPEAATAPAP
jgi:hypothetical protein